MSGGAVSVSSANVPAAMDFYEKKKARGGDAPQTPFPGSREREAPDSHSVAN
ncbi:hypothetical protein L514_1925 [Bordetella bronchiseptica MBORD635]|nr:hypothetical protein L514_1925 [Bordetella bronchiseptica MBORD635]BDC27633.1 hypothetical protein NB2BOR_A19240 [Bordetella parapertussis]